MEAVTSFVRALHNQRPDLILVSGGADGVDTTAEKEWLSLGGTVWSFRVRKKAEDCFAVELWKLGTKSQFDYGDGLIYELIEEPTWADWASALLYRSLLVVDIVGRVVAFHGIDRMRGTEFTTTACKDFYPDKPLHIYREGEWQ